MSYVIAQSPGFSDTLTQAGEKTAAFLKGLPLKSVFSKAATMATGAGLSYAFKQAAMTAAMSAGANVVAAAAVGGIGITSAQILRDYHTFRKTQEDKRSGVWGWVKDCFGFAKDNKVKYAKKLAMNMGLGAVGAEALQNWDVIKDGLGAAKNFWGDAIAQSSPKTIVALGAVKDSAQGAWASVQNFWDRSTFNFSPIGTAYAEEVTPSPAAGAPAPAPVVPAVAGLDLSSIKTDGWDMRALKDLAAARAGKPWALQNLAHYAANGLHGMPKDFVAAHELAQQAKVAGSTLSDRFLANLERLHPELASPAAPAPVDVAQAPHVRDEIINGKTIHHEATPAPAPEPVFKPSLERDFKDSLMGLNPSSEWGEHVKGLYEQAVKGSAEAKAAFIGYAQLGLDGIHREVVNCEFSPKGKAHYTITCDKPEIGYGQAMAVVNPNTGVKAVFENKVYPKTSLYGEVSLKPQLLLTALGDLYQHGFVEQSQDVQEKMKILTRAVKHRVPVTRVASLVNSRMPS